MTLSDHKYCYLGNPAFCAQDFRYGEPSGRSKPALCAFVVNTVLSSFGLKKTARKAVNPYMD